MQAFIANGWAHRVVDPDNFVHSAGKAEPFTTTWEIPSNIEFKKLQEAFTGTSTQETFFFTNGNTIDYFVTRASFDGKGKSDFKSINVSALNMFRCGHVHEVMLGYDKHIYIQAKCWPEMKKDTQRKHGVCTSIYNSPYKYSLTDVYGNGTVFVCSCEELTLTKHKRNRGIIELLSKTWTACEKPPENYNSL